LANFIYNETFVLHTSIFACSNEPKISSNDYITFLTPSLIMSRILSLTLFGHQFLQ
jgi:hypothetical protein